PNHFKQKITLTNGATMEILSLSSLKPYVILTQDSFNHPTWNTKDNKTNGPGESENIKSFKEKFGDLDL
ncbi:hypothetical protein ROZALSC1DRAFT_2619, partial [Rozella allomycis CSF55]